MTVTVTDTVTVPAIAPGDTTCREFSLRLNACCSTQMWFPITILRALCVIHTDFRDFRAEPRQAEKLFPLLGLGSVSEIIGFLGLGSVRPRTKNWCSVSVYTEQPEPSAELARLVCRPGDQTQFYSLKGDF